MDPDKIIQLTIRLMELTSSEKIQWALTEKKIVIGDDELDTIRRYSNYRNASVLSAFNPAVKNESYDILVYSAKADTEDKVFRLEGVVYKNGKYGPVRFQLWNSDNTELEYEFPSNASYVNLFHLVRNFAAGKADEFVDSFLEKTGLLETAR